MALLAEELVQEWLNRQGYFTIRGIKLGVHEIDLLAVRWLTGTLECRHVEVQASVRPMSYLSGVPKSVQKATGRAPGSAKGRGDEELRVGVAEWTDKKFHLGVKRRLRDSLAPGPWSLELVVHRVRHPHELELVRELGVKVHALAEIVQQLRSEHSLVRSAAGADFVDLILLEAEAEPSG